MSTYRIEHERKAMKQLALLPRHEQERIMRRIDGLSSDPRPAGVEKMQGQADAYRVRQGNYRIVYIIDDAQHIITITRIGDRKDIYR